MILKVSIKYNFSMYCAHLTVHSKNYERYLIQSPISRRRHEFCTPQNNRCQEGREYVHTYYSERTVDSMGGLQK